MVYNMEGFCRGCLIKYDDPMELLQYTEKNRRLFVYSTGLQVKRNDTFTFQLCKDCFLNMKQACKFKKLCRTSDKRFKNYLALKDVGDPLDFCTFLKNNDDTMTFRLPMISGNSTPANQKCRDDDNDSTCTSIRNFMTDILQGEEMPDTEARIIREVIEEEADVLDDSLDSHWLQDDMSIDTDFRLDFSFSPFSTPRSVNNDRCFTPKKYDQKEEQHHYYTSTNEKQKEIINNFTNSFKNEKQNEIVNEFTNAFKNNENEIKLCDYDLPSIEGITKSESNLGLPSLDEFDGIEKSESNIALPSLVHVDGIEKSESSFSLPSLEDVDKVNIDIQNFYIAKNDIESIECSKEIINNSFESKEKDKTCTIDKNLEEALKNEDNKEFSLDDLLVSPPVFQGTSAASTPTITNILFGEKLDIADTNTNAKHEKCIETFEDVQGDIEIFEEFFQNDTKELDIEDVKKVNLEINGDSKEPISLGNLENCDSANNLMDIDINTSINRKDQVKKEEDVDIKSTDKKEKIITEIDITVTSGNDKFDLENFFCKLCNKKFMSVKALSIHFAKTHQIKIIKPKDNSYLHKVMVCSKCGKEMLYGAFYKHSKTCQKHKENQIYKCDRCPIECSTPQKLERHKSSHTGIFIKKDTGKAYICTVCGVSINKIGNYKLHVRRHTNSYTMWCPECGKGFYRLFDYTNHMRIHTGDRPFSCAYCAQTFRRRDCLTRHIKSHINERRFQCDHCGSKFMKKYVLKNHVIGCFKRQVLNTQKNVVSNDKDVQIQEEVTVIYMKGDENTIRNQLPFLETEMSN